jgi:hypothetical protein
MKYIYTKITKNTRITHVINKLTTAINNIDFDQKIFNIPLMHLNGWRAEQALINKHLHKIEKLTEKSRTPMQSALHAARAILSWDLLRYLHNNEFAGEIIAECYQICEIIGEMSRDENFTSALWCAMKKSMREAMLLSIRNGLYTKYYANCYIYHTRKMNKEKNKNNYFLSQKCYII